MSYLAIGRLILAGVSKSKIISKYSKKAYDAVKKQITVAEKSKLNKILTKPLIKGKTKNSSLNIGELATIITVPPSLVGASAGLEKLYKKRTKRKLKTKKKK